MKPLRRAVAIVILFCALVLLWASMSNAMEFTTRAMRAGVAIYATGPIDIGDAVKFQRVAPQATVDDKGLRRIVLESPGGNVAEAVRIAALIRAYDFVTLVSGECASACAMVLYPAGKYFMLLDGGKLGFHPCYNADDLTQLPECTEGIAKLAAQNGFPHGSIKMFASLVGPQSMYWVSNVLAYCYGMEHFIGDPAPVTVSNTCPLVGTALYLGKFRNPNRPSGPGFDCNKASTPVEMLLCRDSELTHLNSLMTDLYKMLRQRENQSDSALLASQRAWIVERDNKCPVSLDLLSSLEKSRDAARCISEMTMVRMNKLLEINGTPRQDLSPLFELLKKQSQTAY